MESTLVKHWQTIYQTKDTTKVAWYQEKPQVSLNLIDKIRLRKNAAILDVGGGDSKLVDLLLEKGYQDILILDISEAASEKIKFRLGDWKERIKFVVSNILDFKPAGKFRLWHDRATFHFLTDANDQVIYRNLVGSSLSSGGYLIVATFSNNGPNTCSGLPVKQYSIKDLEEFFGQEFHLLEGINYDHITPSGSVQNFSVCLFRRI